MLQVWEALDGAGVWVDVTFAAILVAIAVVDRVLVRRWSR